MNRFAQSLISVSVPMLLLFIVSNLSAAEPEAGFKSLFNGKDLIGWAGRPEHWSVEDGAITGRTTKEKPAKGNNFLIAKDGEKNLVVSDFELRLSYKIVANNTNKFGDSGVQYRSKELPDFVVSGYQANLMVTKPLTGILYEEKGRGIIHQLGQKVVIKTDANDPKKPRIEVVGSLGKSEEIQASFKTDDWNDYVIIAQGNHLQHFINGKQTADVTDEDEARAVKSGILALQLHAGQPMTVQFKNIRIKMLSGTASAKSDVGLLQGDWAPLEIVANGEKASEDALSKIHLKIKGNEYFLETNNGPSQGSFKISESGNPRSMDVTTQSGDELPAIYEISGDTFKACYAVNGAARPTEFKSTEGSDHVLAVYKRKSP